MDLPGLRAAARERLLPLLRRGAVAAARSHLYPATGRFYGSRRGARIAKVALLTTAVGAIALAYRFTIFLITLYTS